MPALKYFILATLLGSQSALATQGSFEVILESTATSLSQEAYGLRWNSQTKTCQGFHSEDGSRGWNALPTTTCETVLGFYEKHQKEIRNDPAATRDLKKRVRLHLSPHSAGGVLRFNDLQIPVEWMVSEVCDVTLTQCHSPKLSRASEFGKLLREEIYRATEHP